jgi:hypothetical protein
VIRAFWELLCATLNYGLARVRGIADPCPPHDFTHGWEFCEKCGKTKSEIPRAELIG